MGALEMTRQGSPERERRERQFQAVLNPYTTGSITCTEVQIRAGLAPRSVNLAYRFPLLFGRLAPLAAADQRRPMYAPDGGWRVHESQSDPWPPEPPRLSYADAARHGGRR